MRTPTPALRDAKPIGDELKGVTAGTGLAMMLRNYGLVLRPEKSRGKPVVYRIAVADADALAPKHARQESDTDDIEVLADRLGAGHGAGRNSCRRCSNRSTPRSTATRSKKRSPRSARA